MLCVLSQSSSLSYLCTECRKTILLSHNIFCRHLKYSPKKLFLLIWMKKCWIFQRELVTLTCLLLNLVVCLIHTKNVNVYHLTALCQFPCIVICTTSTFGIFNIGCGAWSLHIILWALKYIMCVCQICCRYTFSF